MISNQVFIRFCLFIENDDSKQTVAFCLNNFTMFRIISNNYSDTRSAHDA